MKTIKDYIRQHGLTIVDTNDGQAVIGFKTYAQAEELYSMLNTDIVELRCRKGRQVYKQMSLQVHWSDHAPTVKEPFDMTYYCEDFFDFVYDKSWKKFFDKELIDLEEGRLCEEDEKDEWRKEILLKRNLLEMIDDDEILVAYTHKGWINEVHIHKNHVMEFRHNGNHYAIGVLLTGEDIYPYDRIVNEHKLAVDIIIADGNNILNEDSIYQEQNLRYIWADEGIYNERFGTNIRFAEKYGYDDDKVLILIPDKLC